jgi:hypothetical protein
MTSFTNQAFGVPSSARQARALDSASERAVDRLGGRTVWCAVALASHRAQARELLASVIWGSGRRVPARPLELSPVEPLGHLAQRLDAMLLGGTEPRAGVLGPAEWEVRADCDDAAEGIAGEGVHRDDVVVLNDPLGVLLARALRERGAHVVWHVNIAPAASAAEVADAWEFLREYASAVDAYIVTGRTRTGRAETLRVAAVMPAAGVVAAKDVPLGHHIDGERPRDVGWNSALADVVAGDRGQSVGGTVHVRPAVAAR